MPIKGQCPNCRAPFGAPDEMLGRTGRCKRCGVQFPIRRDGASSWDLPAAIDRYQLRELLGRGTFGAVYRAFDPRLEREVALKVLRPEMTSSPESVQRFLREAKAAAKLTHPHIVPVHDAGRAGALYFIASAFIPGKTLASAIPVGGMESRRAADLAAQLASALGHAHRQGVLHRDVKPANALLDEEGALHLTDFGLAGWTHEEATRLTRQGAMMGTPAYMAPEQASGNTAQMGPASDLYSAGVVLYELLTGRPPFQGHTAALVYQIVHVAAPPPSQHRPGLDPRLETVCLKALAKEPAQRYRTGEEMATALRAAVVQEAARPVLGAAGIGGTTEYRPDPAAVGAVVRLARNDVTESDVSQIATPGPAGKVALPARPRGRSRPKWVRWGVAAAVVLATLACVAVAWSLSHRPGRPPVPDPTPVVGPPAVAAPLAPAEVTMTGKVVRVDKDELTANVGDKEEVFTVPADAKVRIDGADGKLADVKKGGTVTITRNGDSIASVTVKNPVKPSLAAAPFDAAEARRLQQAWADYLGVPVVREVDLGGVTMTLVLIPPGTFLMGSPDTDQEAFSDEKPQHKATLTKPYYLGVYPVTQEQYNWVTGKRNPSWFQELNEMAPVGGMYTAQFPVEAVSWDDAAAFCELLNQKDAKRPAEWKYGLPTEAQWEHACRAGATSAYFFGDDPKKLHEYAWCDGNSGDRTHEVGTRKPNAWGLYDMAGNVWQWCQDDDGIYSEKDAIDPLNSANRSRVGRGGSWNNPPRYCRAACRSRHEPGERYGVVGCRVCLCLD